ncbi:hypothetical protein CE91St41_24920 [Oscillospiraceae bacterium]|nr:hypothetical protein CE91St40_12620 [Oscillospiraceae bacterium]BDF75603.1 hypothetical protein CE91St41_24920 [Oscillospiraceae bacterium]
MAAAAASFSSAVIPPSRPPGRDSRPDVGWGLSAGAEAAGAGVSAGAWEGGAGAAVGSGVRVSSAGAEGAGVDEAGAPGVGAALAVGEGAAAWGGGSTVQP